MPPAARLSPRSLVVRLMMTQAEMVGAVRPIVVASVAAAVAAPSCSCSVLAMSVAAGAALGCVAAADTPVGAAGVCTNAVV